MHGMQFSFYQRDISFLVSLLGLNVCKGSRNTKVYTVEHFSVHIERLQVATHILEQLKKDMNFEEQSSVKHVI